MCAIGFLKHEIEDEYHKNSICHINIVKKLLLNQHKSPQLPLGLSADPKTLVKRYSKMRYSTNVTAIQYPSKPPSPMPKSCSKCLSLTHSTELCHTTATCPKFYGPHSSSRYSFTLPLKCTVADLRGLLNTPKRCTASITGIPNDKLNHHGGNSTRKENIKNTHNPIAIHNMIINPYIGNLNDSKNINRVELLQKLEKKIIHNYNVDSTTVFSGSQVYIPIFSKQ